MLGVMPLALCGSAQVLMVFTSSSIDMERRANIVTAQHHSNVRICMRFEGASRHCLCRAHAHLGSVVPATDEVFYLSSFWSFCYFGQELKMIAQSQRRAFTALFAALVLSPPSIGFLSLIFDFVCCVHAKGLTDLVESNHTKPHQRRPSVFGFL